MTAIHFVPPSPSALIGSMRGVGYSLETALADLIDNSLSAGAKAIELTLDWNDGNPTAVVIDDGVGMDPQAMIEAMRFGGRGPQMERPPSDLGRFGLGLKTASLSQCRRLRLISKCNAAVHSFTWDLDHIAETGDGWDLIEDGDPLPAPVVEALNKCPAGSAVVWEKIDFGRNVDRPDRPTFFADLARAERHLGMVFHRFLSGDGRRVRITLNGNTIDGWDPFLERHEATTPFPEKRLRAPGGAVSVHGFVLPHRDKFRTQEEFDVAGGPGGWASQQGFYVYRHKRLLSAGGWLGLGGSRAWTRDEPSRLARIKIDIPNSGDQEWRIDIKKAVARPPDTIRKELQRIAADIRQKAREVFVHRGAYGPRLKNPDQKRLWKTNASGRHPAYSVSRDHELVLAVKSALKGVDRPLLDALLDLVERTVPVERVWLDVTEHGVPQSGEDTGELEATARILIDALERNGLAKREATRRVLEMDPFDQSDVLRKRLAPPDGGAIQ